MWGLGGRVHGDGIKISGNLIVWGGLQVSNGWGWKHRIVGRWRSDALVWVRVDLFTALQIDFHGESRKKGTERDEEEKKEEV